MFASGLERPSVWAIIAIAALVLFGYKKLPEMSRSVGKSLRIFKTEMKGLNSDDAARNAAEAKATEAQPPVTPPAPAADIQAPVPPAPATPTPAPPATGQVPQASAEPPTTPTQNS
ncbi:MAG TPA: Sec-independent protein translocase subunit TatA [Jatrophihabitans sp.]